jgi:hypothetical protein
MGPSGETWSRWILGHRPFTRLHQIDRLVEVIRATGTYPSPAFHLPHGRYSVFVDADPPRAAQAFDMVNRAGFHVHEDWRWIPENIANVPAPLVQYELLSGDYRITIEMSSSLNAWQAQVVLNSMLSWELAPKPWSPRVSPPRPIPLSAKSSPSFVIEHTGHYATDLTLAGFRADATIFPEKFCPFRLALRSADGHRVLLGEGETHHASWPSSFHFLGAGRWTVEMETACDWQLVIKPMVGSAGAGTRWF